MIFCYFFLLGIIATAQNLQEMSNTIYQFKVEDIEGKEFDLATLKGKKVISLEKQEAE